MDCACDNEWRARVRRCLVHKSAYVLEHNLVWLAEKDDFSPLASLAECGAADCGCTRSFFPWVRSHFRDEVMRRAVLAWQCRALPASGVISYTSIGSGLLLGDLDVLAGLQRAGFQIGSAAFVDNDYSNACQGALSEMARYLAPARVVAYKSTLDYARARLTDAEPASHIFVQIDCASVKFVEAATLSAISLSHEGGGLGFRLCNKGLGAEMRHAERTLQPRATMDAWHRRATPKTIFEAFGHATKVSSDEPADETGTYARICELIDPRPLVVIDVDDALISSAEPSSALESRALVCKYMGDPTAGRMCRPDAGWHSDSLYARH